MLLTDLLKANIQKYGEYPLIYYKEKIFTNIECEQMSNKVTFMLNRLGVKKGDRIVCCLPNCPEVFFVYQGILKTGSIIIPVMNLLHEKEINFILQNSEAKAIVTSSSLLSKVLKATEGLSVRPKVICVESPHEVDALQDIEVIDWQKNLSENTEQIEMNSVELSVMDVAVILYTSGTTGKPKGVMLTHKNLYTSVSAIQNASGSTEQEKTLVFLPLAHVYGIEVMNSCFILGNSAVIFPKFQVDIAFAAIEKYLVKSLSVVPAMVHEMVLSTEDTHYNLSSLEWISSGSAMLPINLIEKFREKFKAEVLEGYGLSEASPTVTTHRGLPVKDGSVGAPIPGVQIQVVNEKREVLELGEIGELIVKGDNITPGYFRNDELTKETIIDGWLYTGDMAKIDEDGYLYIVDRKKDLIIRGGFNIYPRDLEELLAKYKGVSEVAVFGVPCDRMGEEIVACVVKKENSKLTEIELINYCETQLAKYKIPRRVVFIEKLPRSGVGKILKRQLQEIYSKIDIKVV